MALAVSNVDISEVEIDVLDSEPKALEDPHPGAVEQQNDELNGTFESGQEGRHFFAAEDGGEPLGLTGSDDVVDPRRVDFEHFTIEEKDGAQRLSLGGGGDVVVDGEMG